MAKQTTANLRERGRELTVQQHDTDSHLIPVAQLERLHEFRPDRVDWVIQQTGLGHRSARIVINSQFG